MIFVSIVFLNKKEIQEIQIIPFEENDFNLKTFLNGIESQNQINDMDDYIKVQIWLQNEYSKSSELLFEKEFVNGSCTQEKVKTRKEGSILKFSLRKKPGQIKSK